MINNHDIIKYIIPSVYLSATHNKLFGNFEKNFDIELLPIFLETKSTILKNKSNDAIP